MQLLLVKFCYTTALTVLIVVAFEFYIKGRNSQKCFRILNAFQQFIWNIELQLLMKFLKAQKYALPGKLT